MTPNIVGERRPEHDTRMLPASLAGALPQQDGERSDGDWIEEGSSEWVEGRAMSAIKVMDKMIKTEPGSSSFESYAASLARMLAVRSRAGAGNVFRTGFTAIETTTNDALPLALILNSRNESTLTIGINEALRRISTGSHNLQVLNGANARKATLETRLISMGALESILKIRRSSRLWTACPAAKELFQTLSKIPSGVNTLCDVLENELTGFVLAEGHRDRTTIFLILQVLTANASSISDQADIRQALEENNEKASDIIRNSLSVLAILFSKQDHEACEKVISFVFMMLSPRRRSHNPSIKGAASAMRSRNQQGGATAQSALALAAEVEQALEETGETEDEFDSSEWVGDLSRSTEEEFPLRSPDPPAGTERQAHRWTELFAHTRRTAVQEICQPAASKSSGSWTPTDVSPRMLRVILLQLADLDHYCDQQQELRHILWSLSVCCKRSRRTLSNEMAKLSQELLDKADAYMSAIATLASQQGVASIPSDFDESIVYHLLTQMHILRSWKLSHFPCEIPADHLHKLLSTLGRYLKAIQGCLCAEEFLIEDPSQRRLIKSRHFTRAPYIVDCVRVAALQEVCGPPTMSFCALQRRFLQTTLTPAFRAAVTPHNSLLNALIQAMPSVCDDAGPLSFMMVNSLLPDCKPAESRPPSAAARAAGADANNAVLLCTIPDPLTFFATRRALFRHRAAIIIQFDLSDVTERQDWITSDSPSGIRILCRRKEALRDSISVFKTHSHSPTRSRLFVRFEGEPASGMGVTREWFQVIASQLFDPARGFFRKSASGNGMELNACSAKLSSMGDHLRVFRFTGQFLALALLHGVPLDIPLSIPFVKAMLGVPLVLQDLEKEDPELFQNLTWLLHNTAEDLGLSFQHCIEYHGSVHSVPLRPGGHLEAVTDTNKAEYISLLVNMRVTRPVRPQLRAMRDGFHGVLPRPVLEVLSLTDIISMLAGESELDVDDWEASTEVVGWTRGDKVVRWFFNMLRRFPNKKRSQVLLFSASLSRPPIGGFAALPTRFRLCKCDLPLPRLPVAHTCFAELIIPEYKTEESLVESFELALNEAFNTFGLA